MLLTRSSSTVCYCALHTFFPMVPLYAFHSYFLIFLSFPFLCSKLFLLLFKECFIKHLLSLNKACIMMQQFLINIYQSSTYNTFFLFQHQNIINSQCEFVNIPYILINTQLWFYTILDEGLLLGLSLHMSINLDS